MKRLIPAVILTFFLVFICIFSHVKVKELGNATKNDLSYALSTVDKKDKDETKDAIKKLNKKWDDRCRTLSLFVNRGKLEEVTDKIQTLKSYTESKDEFEEECTQIKVLLDAIIKEQDLTMSTFF